MTETKRRRFDLKARLRTLITWLSDQCEHHALRLCMIAAPIINYLVESMSRHSVFEAIVYIGEYPVPFWFNSMLVFLTMLGAALFKKRLFHILFAGCVWLWGGIVNGVLLTMRVTPFGFSDFRNIKQAFDIVDIYMKPWQIALCSGGLLLFLLLMVRLYIKAPRFHLNLKPLGGVLAAFSLAFCFFGHWAIDTGRISETFGNLADAYDQYGFVYCFAKSAFDQGVDRPDAYSDTMVEDVLEEVADEIAELPDEPEVPMSQPQAPLKHPNIIIVQLESFFDVNRMEGIDFSSDPLPVFTRLMQENTSGYFTVPSIGAGTVNTEFEVLTGMSLAYFGTGEYPYKTILRESVCPSLAYDLKEYGYRTYAIHNNNGTFYDRNKVYPNLGFDHFISIEYMDNIRENALGWAKDSILTEQILKCLDSGENSDFVYTVAVQPHGRYPTERVGDAYPISVSGLSTLEEKSQWEYYAGQMYETDRFIGELIRALDSRGEPYICVFYGDHLPSLDILDDELTDGSIYQTEYVICSNLEHTQEKEDIDAYQLSAKVLEMAGLEGNVLIDLHQTRTDDPDYQSGLELLEYDILYGECMAYGGALPYEPTDLQMGVDPITISKVYVKDDMLYVEGKNLTWESHIFVNGKPHKETVRLNENTLCAEADSLEPEDVVSVVQMGNDGEPLSYTNELLIN